jgi:hypothetical protein
MDTTNQRAGGDEMKTPAEKPPTKYTARQLAALSLSDLRTHEQHLLFRAGAGGAGRPEAHTHSRQLAEVRAEIARRAALR